MSAQHEIKTKHKLLDGNGSVSEPGYSTKYLLDYDRKDIKAPKFRIKEWDYYYIGNRKYGVAMTIADNGYMSLISVSVLDFEAKTQMTANASGLFPMGKLNLPVNSVSGVCVFKNKNVDIKFVTENGKRKLTCDFKNAEKGKDFKADIELISEPEDSMFIATPFKENKHAFYYNQKINCMPAKGTVTFGDRVLTFDPADSMGSLDWGRGVWTYVNTWYWGSMSVRLPDGSLFGYNIGYGFGDTSAASENMLFLNGKAHKLGQVKFEIPVKNGKDDFLSPWKFTSDDGRFELDFTPILDRSAYINVLLLETNQHQVFGKCTGKVILDGGKVLEINDQMAFAEKVKMKY